MGYKLAGFEVIGCNEIDPRMMEAYKENHHPRLSYLEDIRIFKNRTDLPEELYHLDILDGSPPCSSFSTAGNREEDWGKKKKFKEGQQAQILDTLFFDFIDLAKRLQSKVVVAENVKGLLMGSAREYYKKICFAFEDAGYEIQSFLLNAADMGVPQKRERVFFVGLRRDLCAPFMQPVNLFHHKPILDLKFKERRVPFREIEEVGATSTQVISDNTRELWSDTRPGDDFVKAWQKKHSTEKRGFFSYFRMHHDNVLNTIVAHKDNGDFHYSECRGLSRLELCRGGSFPEDYDFCGNPEKTIIGMSVPPLMIAKIATRIWEQWLSKFKGEV